MAMVVTTLLMACSAVKTPYSTNFKQADAALSVTAKSLQASAKDVGNRAMTWQLARMDNFEKYIVKMNKTADPKQCNRQ